VASPITHAIAAAALAVAAFPALPRAAWAAGAACAIVPDFDILGLALGVPRESTFGHRGIMHSLVFAAALGAVVARALGPTSAGSVPAAKRWLYFFLATSSHGVLDALTNGGRGVAFLAPFDDRRWFFPFRPIAVSPIAIRPFFGARGLEILRTEIVWIWLPSAVLVAAVSGWRWWRSR
jgi:inner membrane protein